MRQGMWYVRHIVSVPVFTLRYILWCILVRCEPLLKKRIVELRACSCNQATSGSADRFADGSTSHSSLSTPGGQSSSFSWKRRKETSLWRPSSACFQKWSSDGAAPPAYMWLCCVGPTFLCFFFHFRALTWFQTQISPSGGKSNCTSVCYHHKFKLKQIWNFFNVLFCYQVHLHS